jgi:phage terminase large subunit GpA-like protein
VLGVGSSQGTLVVDRFNKHYGQRTFSISTDSAKDIIYSRLQITDIGPRFCHIPRSFGYTDDWMAQLTCERVVTRYTRGFPRRIYEKPNGARNEALDMRVYALGCLDILRPNMAAIAASLNKSNTPAVKKEVRNTQRRGGWVSGWR